MTGRRESTLGTQVIIQVESSVSADGVQPELRFPLYTNGMNVRWSFVETFPEDSRRRCAEGFAVDALHPSGSDAQLLHNFHALQEEFAQCFL